VADMLAVEAVGGTVAVEAVGGTVAADIVERSHEGLRI
jgi:hypothetical protein